MNNTKTKQEEGDEGVTPADADYVQMVMPKLEKDSIYVQEKGVPAKINYYCRNCKKEVGVKKIPGKLAFKCNECEGERVAFGSEDSIQNYYKLLSSKERE